MIGRIRLDRELKKERRARRVDREWFEAARQGDEIKVLTDEERDDIGGVPA
jgi:hypothetical protein